MSIREQRLTAMFDAMDSGVHSTMELLDAADAVEKRIGLLQGFSSEARFQSKAWSHYAWVIQDLQRASPEDDSHGIDFFITFKNSKFLSGLSGRRVPVKVKSSLAAVESFKRNKSYMQLEREVMVINCGLGVTNSQFECQFRAEMSRLSRRFGRKLTNT